MNTEPEKLAAQRCALIWFSITSKRLFDALRTPSTRDQALAELGLNQIDPVAFDDVAALLKNPEYQAAVVLVGEMWRIFCSPPPCFFEPNYPELLAKIEEGVTQRANK